MLLDRTTRINDVHGLTDTERALISAFLLGAVYCWIKNKKDQPFSLRDLVGGENTYWGNIPLHAIYKKHTDLGKDPHSAFEDAAKDAGWLLKRVINDDQRSFNFVKLGLVNSYSWIGNEP